MFLMSQQLSMNCKAVVDSCSDEGTNDTISGSDDNDDDAAAAVAVSLYENSDGRDEK